jgi:hypothetical protein
MAIRSEDFSGKVARIGRHDDAGVTMNYGGKHMLIIWISQGELADQALISADQRVIDIVVHKGMKIVQKATRSRRHQDDA